MSQSASGSLASKSCKACQGQVRALSGGEVEQFCAHVPQWEVRDGQLRREFKFANYHETIAFVNATAWVSHREDHHPDLEVGYNKCIVRYSTHSVGGLSENDFICAAKIDSLLAI